MTKKKYVITFIDGDYGEVYFTGMWRSNKPIFRTNLKYADKYSKERAEEVKAQLLRDVFDDGLDIKAV